MCILFCTADQWGTVVDTLGYQITGGIGDWMDSDRLGLGAAQAVHQAVVRIEHPPAFDDEAEAPVEPVRRDVRVQSFMSWRVEGQTMCSIGVSGADVDGLVQELWQTGHPVMNVSR